MIYIRAYYGHIENRRLYVAIIRLTLGLPVVNVNSLSVGYILPILLHLSQGNSFYFLILSKNQLLQLLNSDIISARQRYFYTCGLFQSNMRSVGRSDLGLNKYIEK